MVRKVLNFMLFATGFFAAVEWLRGLNDINVASFPAVGMAVGALVIVTSIIPFSMQRIGVGLAASALSFFCLIIWIAGYATGPQALLILGGSLMIIGWESLYQPLSKQKRKNA